MSRSARGSLQWRQVVGSNQLGFCPIDNLEYTFSPHTTCLWCLCCPLSPLRRPLPHQAAALQQQQKVVPSLGARFASGTAGGTSRLPQLPQRR